MVQFYSTNDHSLKVGFEEALLLGQPKDYGLFTLPRDKIPKLDAKQIEDMSGKTYSEIAFIVLNQFLKDEIPSDVLIELLNDAYLEDKIPTEIEKVNETIYIMWLTKGPTYSFKDYAARFFARALNYFLGKRGLKRTVVVATSGDTGGAVADALHGLNNVDNIVFFPKGSVSPGQRRQMTTLKGNVYAFEVNGDFDVCQALAKNLLGDKEFAQQVFKDKERLTSANSISVGRLLPQAVYPFYAYSKIAKQGEKIVASIPSGNFGDMMGTVLAKQMGLPISRILCGVNENTEFPEFLKTGKYVIQASKKSPSSAMIVSHPSNFARLVDFYFGHVYDKREAGKVIQEGIIDKMPDIAQMKKDIFSFSVSNEEHYKTMKEVFERYEIVLDPHGAVGWKVLQEYNESTGSKEKAVIYETADPGKFPEDVKKAIGLEVEVPDGMKAQEKMDERIYSIDSEPLNVNGALKLSDEQISEAKQKIKLIF